MTMLKVLMFEVSRYKKIKLLNYFNVTNKKMLLIFEIFGRQ